MVLLYKSYQKYFKEALNKTYGSSKIQNFLLWTEEVYTRKRCMGRVRMCIALQRCSSAKKNVVPQLQGSIHLICAAAAAVVLRPDFPPLAYKYIGHCIHGQVTKLHMDFIQGFLFDHCWPKFISRKKVGIFCRHVKTCNLYYGFQLCPSANGSKWIFSRYRARSEDLQMKGIRVCSVLQ